MNKFNSYHNLEGYPDPTAGEAMYEIMKDYKQQRRKAYHREQELKSRPKVYVVSRYAGDVPNNLKAARKYCRMVVRRKRMPVASHLLYPFILNDNDPKEREIGTMFGLALLALCDEVWCFGTEPSPGMQKEIEEAKRLKKPIRFFTEEMEEVHEAH